MDELIEYRRIIRKLIQEYAQFRPSVGDVRVEIIFDEATDHYELIYSGWTNKYRIHGSVLHIDIRDGQVWVQYDGTEDAFAEELVTAGIPRERIVLGYKHPEMRPYTDFATV